MSEATCHQQRQDGKVETAVPMQLVKAVHVECSRSDVLTTLHAGKAAAGFIAARRFRSKGRRLPLVTRSARKPDIGAIRPRRAGLHLRPI